MRNSIETNEGGDGSGATRLPTYISDERGSDRDSDSGSLEQGRNRYRSSPNRSKGTRDPDLLIPTPNIGIRTGNEKDIPFLFSRILHEMHALPQFKVMPSRLYFTYAHRIWEHHLTRCVVRVAYPNPYEQDGKVVSGDTRQILGFIVAEPSNIGLVIHYLYTRLDWSTRKKRWVSWRRQGIAKKLVEGMMKDYGMDEVVYTLMGSTVDKFPELGDKVYDTWSKVLSYNHALFWTLLPDKWERGIEATINPEMRGALQETRHLILPDGT